MRKAKDIFICDPALFRNVRSGLPINPQISRASVCTVVEVHRGLIYQLFLHWYPWNHLWFEIAALRIFGFHLIPDRWGFGAGWCVGGHSACHDGRPVLEHGGESEQTDVDCKHLRNCPVPLPGCLWSSPVTQEWVMLLPPSPFRYECRRSTLHQNHVTSSQSLCKSVGTLSWQCCKLH